MAGKGTTAGAAVCAWALAIAAVAVPAEARADDDEGGKLTFSGFLGVQLFDDDSSLGAPPEVTSVSNGFTLGGRIGYQWNQFLGVEGELPITLTDTRDNRATIGVILPRAQYRADIVERRGFKPFAVAGVGMPVLLSTRRSVADNGDISVAGHIGLGSEYDPGRGLAFRFDARYQVLPARGDQALAHEFGFFLGVQLSRKAKKREETIAAAPPPPPPDYDEDGVIDADDHCIERPEDHDGWEDDDGCPDIDNDFDGELDIADQCINDPETHNGYQDTDGCPDQLPDEVAELEGVLDGVAFTRAHKLRPRSHRVLDRLYRTLEEFPSVRIDVVGHVAASDDPNADLLASIQRAEAVMFYLTDKGVRPHRVTAVGLGSGDPLTGDAGDAANTRVEVRLRYRGRE